MSQWHEATRGVPPPEQQFFKTNSAKNVAFFCLLDVLEEFEVALLGDARISEGVLNDEDQKWIVVRHSHWTQNAGCAPRKSVQSKR